MKVLVDMNLSPLWAAFLVDQQDSGMGEPAAKLSITVPSALAAEVRKRVGARGVSSFVTRAIAHELEREQLTAYLRTSRMTACAGRIRGKPRLKTQLDGSTNETSGFSVAVSEGAWSSPGPTEERQ